MTRSSTGKTAEERTAYWRERIAEQERSGMPVQQFCKERSITEQSSYAWRKRLRKQEPPRFVLVETGPARQHAPTTELELVLVTGERLRIGVDPPSSSRMSRGETCLLARRQSVFRRHELNAGFSTERENLALDEKGNDKWLTP